MVGYVDDHGCIVIVPNALFDIAFPPKSCPTCCIRRIDVESFTDFTDSRVVRLKRLDHKIGICCFIILVIQMMHSASIQPGSAA